jgi:hypothetical protein
MPSGGKGPDGGQVIKVVRNRLAVVRQMPKDWLALQIGAVIIERIAILVMNGMTRRNRPIVVNPDRPMEITPLKWDILAGLEIDAICPLPCFGISSIWDTLIDNAFVLHISIISPYRSVSSGINPLPGQKIG